MQKGAVQIQDISTKEKIVDILTMPLSKAKFVYFRDNIGVVDNVSSLKGSVDVWGGCG